MTGRPVRAGVVQMTSTPDLARNLESAARLVRQAQAEGAELVVLPECFALLAPEREKLAIAEDLTEGGPILTACTALARECGVELVLGGFWETSQDPAKVFNSCLHVSKTGELGAVYRKIHLFDVDLPDGTLLKESASVAAGTEVVVAQTALGVLGLSICYDLRFPELYRALVDRGAVALAVPSAFTLTTGKEHWHVLLRARAIEAQAYVLAAAQTGTHFGSRTSYGHALICDPWGTIIAECGEGEGVAVATIDPERVGRVRASLPSLRHRVL